MRQLLAVLTSNAISRYGTIFAIGDLESLLRESWHPGAPYFVSHDSHRPSGWSVGLSLYLEPGLARVTGLLLMPETVEDDEKVLLWVRHSLLQTISKRITPHRPELERRLRPYLSGKEGPLMPNCAALFDEGIATRVFPEIFAQRDKDGLLSLKLLKQVAPGIFEREGLLLFAHPFFRRSLSRLNSLSEPFFAMLRFLSNCAELEIRIALDEDMVGLAGTYERSAEFEYWRGPKFSDDLTIIKTGGVTRHEADEDQRFFHGVSRTEFWWYTQDGRRTFECEEVRNIPSAGAGSDQYGCRYVHSMLDSSTGLPIHIDGAIRMYDERAMVERIDQDILHAGRHADYTKLWRVDGQLDVAKWKELLTHYYRDNKLIGEYLGGEDEQTFAASDESSSIGSAAILSQYTPTSMGPGRGIKLSISYHQRTDDSGARRFIRTFDSFTQDSSEHSYVEAETIDLVKLLQRMGEQIEVSHDIAHVVFQDGVVNLPLVMHTGENAVELAETTQRAIGALCEAWAQYKVDRMVSYNLGVQYADKDVYFSVAGHIADLNIWLRQHESYLPHEASLMGAWAEDAYGALTKQFPATNDDPPLAEMLRQSGMLVFKRRFLKPEEYTVRIEGDGERAIADLVIPKENPELYEAVSSGVLRVALTFWLRESVCSGCGKSYRRCGCIRFLDDGVVQVISDTFPLGVVWNSRKPFFESRSEGSSPL
jgi:hypothetical protein